MARHKDKLLRAIAAEGQVRAFAVNATRLSRRAMRAMSVEDMQNIVEEAEPVQVSCDFCGRVYTFECEEIGEVLNEKWREAS
jgi:redox-regulated HSP33 family molecular chaperone